MSFGRFVFRFRNPIASIPMFYALFSTRWEWENTALKWIIAVAVTVLGVGIRAWATCHCKYASGEKKSLAQTGPYAYIRNPLYVGNTLVILGAVVASELEWLLPIAAAWAIAVYAIVARYEDGVVAARFGDEYQRYKADVPAWIPSRKSLASPKASIAGGKPLLEAFVRQAGNFIFLLPFVLKDLHVFGLGSGR